MKSLAAARVEIICYSHIVVRAFAESRGSKALPVFRGCHPLTVVQHALQIGVLIPRSNNQDIIKILSRCANERYTADVYLLDNGGGFCCTLYCFLKRIEVNDHKVKERDIVLRNLGF